MALERVMTGLFLALSAATASATDCNNNGIEDSVEIGNDPMLDCDGDGLLNVCEVAPVANDDTFHTTFNFVDSAPVTANDVIGNGDPLTVGIEITSNPVQGFLPYWGQGEIRYQHTSPASSMTLGCTPSVDIVRYRLVDCAGGVSNIATLTIYVEHPVPDCNCNWLRDFDETFSGETLDNDGNGVPDECEGPPGPCRIVPVPSVGTDGMTFPDLSADGRYLVYTRGGFSGGSIHLVDRLLGTSEQIAQAWTQGQGGGGDSATVSDDGRLVAFRSRVGTLVPGDTNGAADVFVRDRQSGETRRISLTQSGSQANGPSGAPSISGDGRWVAFETTAANINGGANPTTSRVYLFDLQAIPPAVPLIRITDASGGAGGNGSYAPVVSHDGRFVAFESDATDLVPGQPDTNAATDVFRFDRLAAPGSAIQRISVGAGAIQANSYSYQSSISADGRFVAFRSDATNLYSPDTNQSTDAFVRDTQLGLTHLVSTGPNGPANDYTERVRIAPDGLRVAFCCRATNLLPSGTLPAFISNTFVRELATGTTTLWSVGDLGTAGNGDSGWDGLDLSSGGDVVAFTSSASNFAPTPAPHYRIFLRTCLPTIVDAVCAGDGRGTQCPCGNDSAAGSGRGCLHSFGVGARLRGLGTPRVLADTLTLELTDVPASPGQTATFFQGTRLAGGGLGTVFGDGLRCAVGTVLRLGTRSAATGAASFGYGISGDPAVSTQGAIPGAGATRYYQATYRNALAFCTPSTFNTSNGMEAIWTP